jgi:Ca2+-binding EF-hand superfamily protein
MKAFTLLASAAVGAALLGAAALAQEAPARPPGPLAAFDANADGQVSRDEVDARIRTEFNEADANRNGSLSQAELQAFQEARRAEHMANRPAPPEGREGRGGRRHDRDPAAAFGQADWNQDGAVSFEEFAVRPRMMAARADRNGDGVVTGEELAAGRGRGHGPHGRHGPDQAPPAG